MSGFSEVNLTDVKHDLIDVSMQCSLRGLTHSMQWSSELARTVLHSGSLNSERVSSMFSSDKLLLTEYDKYCVAKSYFDSKEYARAAYWLKDSKSPTATFLYYYSRYMEIEKKNKYKVVQVLDGTQTAERKDIQELIILRNDLKQNEDSLDSYGFYLYGVVLKKLGVNTEAIENLECAVQMNPLHWGAWHELIELCKDRQAIKDLKLPKHWMMEFFLGHSEIELHMNDEALTRYQELCNVGFADSTYIKAQLATALYNLRVQQFDNEVAVQQFDNEKGKKFLSDACYLYLDFDASVEHFKELHTVDPYMLEHIDTYSNILFIQDDRAELSYLAQHVCEVDKYRAESCGVIGNYYSLRNEHEKAVLYFKQALRLNPKYIAAWTLLGHEYVELRNTSAAIESYRKATDLNTRDYRAWYGLGQTYELLKMLHYSLYYYREAQKLRPNDPRMLLALGDTYQNLEKTYEAKKCYLRAVRLGDSEAQATVKLARLHESSGEFEEAARLFIMYLERIDQGAFASTDDQGRACLFLARYHSKQERYEDAAGFARRATEFSETKEEAKTLIVEITKASKSVTLK